MVMSVVTLVTALGAAVDMTRYQTLQARLAHALEAASIAATTSLYSGPPNPFPANCPVDANATAQQVKITWMLCQIDRYFNANIPPETRTGDLQQSITLDVIAGGSTPDCPTPGTACLKAHAVQKTTFIRILGITQLNADAAKTITTGR